MEPIVPGHCLAVKLKPDLYGGCRITGKGPKNHLILEGADWFGNSAPNLEDIEKAKPAKRADNEEGSVPVLIFVPRPSALPRGITVLGRARQPFKKVQPSYGTWWDQVQRELLLAWGLKNGIDIDADEAPSSPKDALLELKSDVKEVVSMWRRDEYDNFKDVILDCSSLRKECTKQPVLRKQVEKVLMEATTQAQELADENLSMAEYMKGLIDRKWLSPKYLAKQAKRKKS